MAQLRDAQTSQFLCDGSPLEVVVVADEIGRKEVLFDDVGENFDPKAVMKSYDDQLAGLDAVAKDDKDKDTRARARDAAKELRATVEGAKKAAAKASNAMKKARA